MDPGVVERLETWHKVRFALTILVLNIFVDLKLLLRLLTSIGIIGMFRTSSIQPPAPLQMETIKFSGGPSEPLITPPSERWASHGSESLVRTSAFATTNSAFRSPQIVSPGTFSLCTGTRDILHSTGYIFLNTALASAMLPTQTRPFIDILIYFFCINFPTVIGGRRTTRKPQN